MSGERFTLDTNVLYYYLDTGAGPRHRRAIQIVERAVAVDCWLTLQSVSEFYVAMTRKGVVPPARAAAVANDWLEAFPAAPHPPARFGPPSRPPPPDARHIGTRCSWSPPVRPGAPPY